MGSQNLQKFTVAYIAVDMLFAAVVLVWQEVAMLSKKTALQSWMQLTVMPETTLVVLKSMNWETTLNSLFLSPSTVSSYSLYTLNHKKRDILFLTITLASLSRFL